MKHLLTLALAASLAACATTPVAGPAGLPVAQQWTIGLNVNGHIRSVGTQLQPAHISVSYTVE